jgi:TPP-dependent pyruvate/acetoin dehydrogenase alpha subunit
MPKRPTATSAAAPHPLISNERLQHLYITLLRGQLLRPRNRLADKASALVAREAIVAGTVTHLEGDDVVMPAAGDRLAALARGNALRRIVSGKPLTGVLPAASTAQAAFALAGGYAFARQGSKQAVLAFSGPGVNSLEPLRPALAYAGQHKLGIVFVIETAGDADLSSAAHTGKLGVYSIPVDGNDVVAVYRVAQESIQRARRGVGPTLIDCKPWPADGTADPVRRLEQTLERRGIETRRLKERTVSAFRKEMAAANQKRAAR